MLLTPGTAGVILYQAITTAAASHTLSCMVRRSDDGVVTNSDMQAYIDGVASNFDSITLVGQHWYRCVKTVTETAAAHNTGIKSLSGGTAVYVDAMQFEAKAYWTTYVDGTQEGCSWIGAAHASTSTRSGQSRSGGKVIDIDATYGVKTRSAPGLGMPAFTHNVTEQALLPGSLLQSIKTQPRQLILQFVAKGTSLANLHSKRKSLIDAFKPNRVTPLQPVRLRYNGAGDEVEIAAFYDTGLEGNLEGGFFEQMVARFICYDPFWREIGDTTKVLTTKLSVANANYIIKKVDGVWLNVSSAFNGTVYAIAQHPDGSVYIGGNFINVGDANGDYIVKYNPITGTLSSLGTGMNDYVQAIKIAPNGDVYAAGLFQSAGGVANTKSIARWDGTAWNAVGTGVTGGVGPLVRDMAIASNGDIYIVGTFTQVGGVANTAYAARWDGSAWNALSTGVAADCYAVAITPDGKVYIGGTFTNFTDANGDHITYFDGSSFHSLGTGIDGSVYTLVASPSGNLYVGGVFSTAGGVSAASIAKWNGISFSALGSGAPAQIVQRIFFINDLLYVVGDFTGIGGLTLADRIACWNGSTWAHLDIDLPGSPTVCAVQGDGEDLYLGYSTSGTATTSAKVTVSNPGSEVDYPKLIIKRSGGTSATLEWLKNETTGKTLWLNYSLLNGERLTIDLTPGAKSITSDFFGNVLGRALLPNSDFANFGLLSGDNDISFYINDVGAPTLTAYLQYRAPYLSVDGVAA